jgi:hypothetical protein
MRNSRTLLHLLIPALLLSCSQPQTTTDAQPAPVATPPMITDNAADTTQPAIPAEDRSTVPFDENGTRYTWTITPAANGTFGFSIYDRGKLYIDQLKATGLGGEDGWKTKLAAREAALAAMAQLEKGRIPEGLNVVTR